MFSIVVTLDPSGDDEGLRHVFSFTTTVVTIGRGDGNELVLPGREVSRRHALIVKQSQGFSLNDLGSANGTLVNQRPVSDPTAIGSQDTIHIGRYSLRVCEVIPASTLGDGHLVAGPTVAPVQWLADDPTLLETPREASVPLPFCQEPARQQPLYSDTVRTPRAPEVEKPAGRPLDDDERELLALIARSPYDDAPRQVYADWLLERGDPSGELISAMCRAVQIPEELGPDASDEAERCVAVVHNVLHRHGKRRLAPLGGTGGISVQPAGAIGAYVCNRPPLAKSDETARIQALWPDGDHALKLYIDRGFLHYPLCVPMDASRAERDALFRLSPALYSVQEEVWKLGRLRLNRAFALAPDRPGKLVAIKRSIVQPELSVPPDNSLLSGRIAASAGMLHEAGILDLVDHPNVIKCLGLAYWGKSGDLAVVLEWHEAYISRRNRDENLPPGTAVAGGGGGQSALPRPSRSPHRHRKRRQARRHHPLLPMARKHLAHRPRPSRPDGFARGGDSRRSPGGRVDPIRPAARAAPTSAFPARYIAPELFDGELFSVQSDIYSTGLLIHDMLCQQGSFHGSGADAFDDIAPPDVRRVSDVVDAPPSLDEVITRATAYLPDRRYATALEMSQDLDRIIAEQGWPSDPTAIAEQFPRLRERASYADES